MMSPPPRPAHRSFADPPAIFLGSNYVPMRPYALIFSFFFFFYSFWIFSFCYSLLFLLSFSISSYSSLLILLFLSLISSYSSLLILLFLSLLILLIPAPPVAASLAFTALLMIYIDKTPPKFQFGKKSAKVFYSLHSSTEQLQVAL